MMSVPVETADDFSFEAAVELFSEPFWFGTGANGASYDVAGDGRFLMIQPTTGSSGTQATHIVLVQNWFEEVRQLSPIE
jgi:hypothetical protein